MDMCSLQASLKAIECICTPKKLHAQSGKKASHKNKAGAKRPSTGATMQVPKKVRFKKPCKTMQEVWGCAYYVRYQGLSQA